MKVEIWTDVVCPFCYIGKKVFDDFRRELPEGETMEVINRSYELSPEASRTDSVNTVSSLADKYGFSLEEARARMAGVEEMARRNGLHMNIFEAKGANTHDLHRLIHFAREKGREEELLSAFFRGHFVEGRSLNQREEILGLSEEAGLSIKEAEAVLESSSYQKEVEADKSKAMRLGIRGVPYFLFDGKYEVSGAQPKEVFQRVYETARKESGAV